MAKILVVDFSSLSLSISDDAKLNESDVKKTADQLTDAFTTIGFAYLSNTGFPQQLVGLLVTYRDGLPARRRSPIRVLTRPSVDYFVDQANVANPYTTPPPMIFGSPVE